MTPPIHVGLAQHPIKKGAGGAVSHNVTDFEWLIIIYTWIHYFFSPITLNPITIWQKMI